MMKTFTVFLCMMLFILHHSGNTQPVKKLTHISYNVNDGLLQSKVNAMCADGNGIIWISCGTGIQRFDGKLFRTVHPFANGGDKQQEKIVSFFKLGNGNLLLSNHHSITEYDLATNRFSEVFHLTGEKNPAPIQVLAEEKDNWWIFLRSTGIVSFNKRFRKFTDTLSFNSKSNIKRKQVDLEQPLFLLDRGILYFADKINGRTDSIQPSPLQERFYTVISYKKDSLLVATTRGIEIFHYPSGTFRLIVKYNGRPGFFSLEHPVHLQLSDAETCIVSEGNEIYELDLQKGLYKSKLVGLQNIPFTSIGYFTGILIDQHQNLWLQTENNGIRKVNYRFSGFRYFADHESKNNFVKTIFADKSSNRILCGLFGGGIQVYDTSQRLIKTIPGIAGEMSTTVCGFYKTSRDHYLVFLMGTWNIYELNAVDYSLRKVQVNINGMQDHIKNIRFADYHLTVHSYTDSMLLLQSSFYLYALKGNRTSWSFSLLDSFPTATVSSYLGEDGRLWVGSHGRYYLYNKDLGAHRSFDVPGKAIVRCFYRDDNAHTWMGSEKGLYKLSYNGKISKQYELTDGLPDENIYAIREDQQDNTWFSHNKGITCRRKDGSFLHFTRNDGLQENEFNTNTSYGTSDGELFFGGVNGISSFYPATVTSYNEKPIVLLTSIFIKEKSWKNDTAGWNIETLSLPYYNNSIALELTAIGNRTADQYNYQYQLTNHDPSWINAGNNPVIRYVLQPGKYLFRYYAGNSFEKDPRDVKELIIIIKPPFWKTTWFLSALSLMLLLSVIIITRYVSQLNLKKKIRDLEQKRMVDEERLRISREMHDDIGAGLTQISLLSEAAKKNSPQEGLMDKIAITSRQLVNSMSTIIWSMNKENSTLDQLLAYLREQLYKQLEYAGIDYTIDFPDHVPPIQLNNAQRRNVLLVTREVVNNVIRHSQAKNLNISGNINEGNLVFDIRDDGKGFDVLHHIPGNGLHNIRRRISELRGTMSLNSTDTGTSFQFALPV